MVSTSDFDSENIGSNPVETTVFIVQSVRASGCDSENVGSIPTKHLFCLLLLCFCLSLICLIAPLIRDRSPLDFGLRGFLLYK